MFILCFCMLQLPFLKNKYTTAHKLNSRVFHLFPFYPRIWHPFSGAIFNCLQKVCADFEQRQKLNSQPTFFSQLDMALNLLKPTPYANLKSKLSDPLSHRVNIIYAATLRKNTSSSQRTVSQFAVRSLLITNKLPLAARTSSFDMRAVGTMRPSAFGAA